MTGTKRRQTSGNMWVWHRNEHSCLAACMSAPVHHHSPAGLQSCSSINQLVLTSVCIRCWSPHPGNCWEGALTCLLGWECLGAACSVEAMRT
jgi:hypothetical protein